MKIGSIFWPLNGPAGTDVECVRLIMVCLCLFAALLCASFVLLTGLWLAGVSAHCVHAGFGMSFHGVWA